VAHVDLSVSYKRVDLAGCPLGPESAPLGGGYCHALTLEIFLFSMFGWSGCDSMFFISMFWPGYGSHSGTGVYRCL
jgi:hypothetical protein